MWVRWAGSGHQFAAQGQGNSLGAVGYAQLAEDTAESALEVAFKLIDVIVLRSANKYDDVIWGAVKGKIKDYLDEKVDDINKADNE